MKVQQSNASDGTLGDYCAFAFSSLMSGLVTAVIFNKVMHVLWSASAALYVHLYVH